jgi:hypothetical protein
MDLLDFTAWLPPYPVSRERLAKVMSQFHMARQLVESLGSYRMHTVGEIDDICKKAGTDRFMVEDIARVLSGSVPAPTADLRQKGFWTLGRGRPRFGAPWAKIQFDEPTKTALLLVRYAGEFDDDEDPPMWVSCQIDLPTAESYQTLWTRVSAVGVVDYWWVVIEDRLTGTLGLRSK